MRTNPIYYAVFGLAALALITLGWRIFAGPYKFKGSQIDPPVLAADFTLTDQSGQPFRLSEQRGKVALIFFGYTNCPDVCPITLTTYTKIRARLGDEAEKVRFIFITVDPERDTVDQVRSHLGNFDPAIIGLTGSRAELETVWEDYGVFQFQHGGGGVEHYDVDHSSRIYAIDPQGNWRLTYPAEMDYETIAKDVEHLID